MIVIHRLCAVIIIFSTFFSLAYYTMSTTFKSNIKVLSHKLITQIKNWFFLVSNLLHVGKLNSKNNFFTHFTRKVSFVKYIEARAALTRLRSDDTLVIGRIECWRSSALSVGVKCVSSTRLVQTNATKLKGVFICFETKFRSYLHIVIILFLLLPTFFFNRWFLDDWLFKKPETVSWIIIFMVRTATRLQRLVLRIAHHGNIIINVLLWYKPLPTYCMGYNRRHRG